MNPTPLEKDVAKAIYSSMALEHNWTWESTSPYAIVKREKYYAVARHILEVSPLSEIRDKAWKYDGLCK